MKFYFCETCGTRITDSQILEGLGRDKKLMGVFCKDCAVGVMTMEFEAISEADLRKPVRKSGGNAIPVNKEFSAESKSPAKRPESRPSKPVVHPHSAPRTGIKPLAIAMAVAGALAVAGTFVLTSGSQPRKNALKEDRSNAPPNEVAAKSQAIQPPPPSPPVFSSPAPPAYDAEDGAIAAFGVLQRFDGLAADDNAGRVERIDAFLAEHGNSVVSARARALRNQLTAKATIPPPSDPSSSSTPKALTPTPEPVTPPKPAAPETVATPAAPETVTAPAAPENPAFRPIMTLEQEETWQFLEQVVAALAKGEIEEPVKLCKSSKFAVSKELLSSLERGEKLSKTAIANLNKNPPTSEIKIVQNKLEVRGRLVRIEDNKAWIKSDNMEIPLNVGALPKDHLLKALDENAGTPADRATLMFSWGDVEQAGTLMKTVAPNSADDLRRVLEQRQALKRLKEFEIAVAATEMAIKRGERTNALSLVEKLTRGYPDIAGGEQVERMKNLAEGARSAGMATTLLKKTFKGEILQADENFFVEIRYDFVKNPRCISDFTGNNIAAGAKGLFVPKGAWEDTDTLRHVAQFQTQPFRIEFLIENGNHDCYRQRIGNVQIKSRWQAEGQIDIAYEPKYSGGWSRGKNWSHPSPNGTYRTTCERDAKSARFLVDGKELGSEVIHQPKSTEAANVETTWTVGFSNCTDCIIKEILIKGTVDASWLKQKARSGD